MKLPDRAYLAIVIGDDYKKKIEDYKANFPDAPDVSITVGDKEVQMTIDEFFGAVGL